MVSYSRWFRTSSAVSRFGQGAELGSRRQSVQGERCIVAFRVGGGGMTSEEAFLLDQRGLKLLHALLRAGSRV